MFLLYIFFVSISLMGASFKFFGKGFAEKLLTTTSNPFIGLFIGILTTSIVQSSSTTTSMTVALVAGGALDVLTAIPIIMGANIGTSVTNTLVSLGHIYNKDEFRRAFAAAIIHDFFNLISVIIIFPLELAFDILGRISLFFEQLLKNSDGLNLIDPLKIIVKPTVNLIIKLTDESGTIILMISVILLFIALRYIVVNLKAIMIGKIEAFINETLFKTDIRALILGLIMTMLVQSSSITTSLAVPLAGAGILSLRQIFPFTLGANVGTTVTAILASLVTGSESAVTVAFAHLMFNVLGICFIWPIKRVPIFLAEKLAEYSLKSKLIPVAYITLVFFIIPLLLIYLVR